MALKYHLAAVMLTAFIVCSACNKTGNSAAESKDKPVSESSFQLGTLIDLAIYGGADNAIFKKAFDLISSFEQKLSRNIESSEVSEINRNAGKHAVKVSEDTIFVIKRSLYYSNLSEGLFDVSVGPLVSLWGIGSENARLPADDGIKTVLDLIDYKNIKIDYEKNMVLLEREKMEIDLGAAAKGFIADKVLELLRGNGVKSAIINLGGNVLLLGKKPDGSLFRIGIQNPFDLRGNYLGIFAGENISIVTSGVYERFFEESGKIYHHILNPETGYPADNDIMGISVVTEKSIEGDCLSTALFMLGSKKALEFTENLEKTEAIIITKDKEIFLSSGIRSSFTLTDTSFQINQM